MKILIVDDELLARQLIRSYLADKPEIKTIEEACDGFEGVQKCRELRPDLIFLDIQMPRLNGFEMLELLDHKPKVIFSTAFDAYAIQAFDANAIDYLLKPYPKSRFDKAFEKVLQRQQVIPETVIREGLPSDRVVIKNGTELHVVAFDEIRYIEAMEDYVKLVTPSKSHLKKQSMQHFETLLQARGFLRIHRSVLVNSRYIQRLEPETRDTFSLILNDGKKLPVSRQGYQRLREFLQR